MAPKMELSCRKFMDDFFFFFSHKKSGHIKNVQKEGIGKKEKRVQARSRSLTQKLGRERPHQLEGKNIIHFKLILEIGVLATLTSKHQFVCGKKCLLYVKKSYTQLSHAEKIQNIFCKKYTDSKILSHCNTIPFYKRKNTLGTRVNLQLQISKKIVIKTLSSYPFFRFLLKIQIPSLSSLINDFQLSSDS